MKEVEQRVSILLKLLPSDMIWRRGKTQEENARNLIKYLYDGIDKGYSSFGTYKRSKEIFCCILQHPELSLLSDHNLVREVARQIIKNNVEDICGS